VTANSALVQYDDIIDAVILLTTTGAFVQYLVSTLRRSIVQARLAQRRTRDILDATSDAIVIHDARKGNIIDVNETTLRMFASNREDLLATDLGASNSANEYVEQARDHVRRAVTDGPQFFEYSRHNEAGSRCWIEVLLRAANIGHEPCVVAVLRDITERRRLEQRVREAEKFRAVGQLAGGVAHDFNNQLTAIIGNAEFMREAAGDNAELRACADSVLTSGYRASDLTRQLLAFARKARRQSNPVNIHRLVGEVVALARRSIDKRIVLEQQLDAQYAVTVGDASALQNALLNLLLNARDAIPSGGTIRFSTRNVDVPLQESRDSNPGLSPGTYVQIDVTDTGGGIDPNILGKIFEPFFTTKDTGTGMGLAAVQGTVLEHQGAVEVASECGRGSTFRIFLPATDEAAEVKTARPREPTPLKHRGQILVVDDEAAVASVARLALQRAGYNVESCSGGLQALELCERQPFDLVLLDVMMPDLDGVEVLRRLKALGAESCVILMTGHAPETLQARLREFPDIRVLPKPFLPSELLREAQMTLGQLYANKVNF
jgi:PAS domain S-box-containing protein